MVKKTFGFNRTRTNLFNDRVLVAILAKASFGVATIRSSMSSTEREEHIKDFNSPDSNIDVFVLNVNVSSSGLNLHFHCSRAIVACPTWNHNTVIQAIGRVCRIGQKKNVEVRILKVADTIFPYLECRSDLKFVHQVMGQMSSTAVKAPLLQMLVGFEIISIIFATHPFNHFSWVAEPPQSVADFYSDRSQRMGEFYSALVGLILGDCPNGLTDNHTYDCVLDFLLVLGPAWIDHEYQAELGGRKVKGKAKNIPNMLDPSTVTWARIRLVMAWIQKHEEYYVSRGWIKMIGVPDSWAAMNPFMMTALIGGGEEANLYPKDWMRHDLSDVKEQLSMDVAQPTGNTYNKDKAKYDRLHPTAEDSSSEDGDSDEVPAPPVHKRPPPKSAGSTEEHASKRRKTK